MYLIYLCPLGKELLCKPTLHVAVWFSEWPCKRTLHMSVCGFQNGRANPPYMWLCDFQNGRAYPPHMRLCDFQNGLANPPYMWLCVVFRMAVQTNPTCGCVWFSEWPCKRTLHVAVCGFQNPRTKASAWATRPRTVPKTCQPWRTCTASWWSCASSWSGSVCCA